MKQVQEFLNINYYLQKYVGELPEPPLHPATKKPVGVEDLAPLFPMEIIKQEVSLEEKIAIPQEVIDIYQKYRVTPLIRADRLEKAIGSKARIYYKYEGVSPSGSHKLNTALVQAYYAKKEGVKRLTTETGAGQWGTALAMACKFFGLDCLVFMVKISFEQKPYRKTLMKLYGAEVIASPSRLTEAGKRFLKQSPKTSGSLGMAISEAIEVAVADAATKYSLGSVLNHVLLHQTVIGQETISQFKEIGDDPDIVIGCCGGGSNFSGLAFPYLAESLKGKRKQTRFVAVEPNSCASLGKGEYKYDSGDTAQMTPLLKMKTLGHDFVPSPIHAGGLRYHGVAPIVAFLHHKKLIEAISFDQVQVFKAGQLFAQSEGIVPAPESAHAIAGAIVEAKQAKKGQVVVFNLSGHGFLDLAGYEDFLQNKLQ